MRLRGGGSSLKLDDRLGGSRLAVPASLLVAEHGDAAPERFVGRADRLVVLVGELDGHHDRVVLEDLAELAELNLLVEAGQVLGHRSAGLIAGRPRLARQDQEDQPAQGQGRRHDADRRQDVRNIEQAVVGIDERRGDDTIPAAAVGAGKSR